MKETFTDCSTFYKISYEIHKKKIKRFLLTEHNFFGYSRKIQFQLDLNTDLNKQFISSAFLVVSSLVALKLTSGLFWKFKYQISQLYAFRNQFFIRCKIIQSNNFYTESFIRSRSGSRLQSPSVHISAFTESTINEKREREREGEIEKKFLLFK